ncbi:hypothetical protein KCP70_06455 [Salmonella enterica subsp. enterica]|nr:hypothetical protein KCP70_06455 [Salmonella enterica subsp. enterica]
MWFRLRFGDAQAIQCGEADIIAGGQEYGDAACHSMTISWRRCRRRADAIWWIVTVHDDMGCLQRLSGAAEARRGNSGINRELQDV